MSSVQHTLTVELGNRSYPIYIGSGLLQQAELLRQHITGKQVMVVTDSTIAPLYLQGILNSLQSLGIRGLQVDSIVLQDGEQHKHSPQQEQSHFCYEVFDRAFHFVFFR